MLLEQSRIREICSAVVEMNLADQRRALFAGLPAFKDKIETTAQIAAQLLIDLDTLNNRPEAYAGEVSPLETWLENTLLLCQKGDPRAKVLADSLHTLKSKRSRSTHPEPFAPTVGSALKNPSAIWDTISDPKLPFSFLVGATGAYFAIAMKWSSPVLWIIIVIFAIGMSTIITGLRALIEGMKTWLTKASSSLLMSAVA